MPRELKRVVPPLKKLMLENGVQRDEETGLDFYTGYKYRTLYDWDLYLEAVTLYYLGLGQYAKNGVVLFLGTQREDGFIPRVFQREHLGWRSEENLEHCKPFLAQTALFASRCDDDFSWLTREMLHKLRKYLNYWLDDCDRDGNGLSEWLSAPHSGQDNHFERCGGWQAAHCEGVDLNCFIVRECRALAVIADRLGDPQQAADLREAADARRDAIRNALWDGNDGFYCDRHRRTGNRIPLKYGLAFASLWAEVATSEQARTMVARYLTSRDHFWTEYPVANYARSEPAYTQTPRDGDYSACTWRGSLWAPTNYFIFQGLRKYGFGDEALALAEKSFEVFVKNDAPSEFYDAETGEGRGQTPFWGWSGIMAFMPAELEAGCDPTDLEEPGLRDKVNAVREIAGTA